MIPALDVSSIYEVPLSYHEQGLDAQVCRHFRLDESQSIKLDRWTTIVNRVHHPEGEVKVAVVGKYTSLPDSYKSLAEALTHGGIANHVKVHMDWLDSQIFETDEAVKHLEDVHAILVPGGFGERGSSGKIAAARFARERQVPYFGICFGMQMAVIEAARNLVGLPAASSTEFGPTKDPVVGLMTEWLAGNQWVRRNATDDLGGTMRLGAYPAALKAGSKVAEIYGANEISERHRHRYEVNIEYSSVWKRQAWFSPACRPMASCPKSSSATTIRGSSACNSILNSNRSPSIRIRCSPRSSRRRSTSRGWSRTSDSRCRSASCFHIGSLTIGNDLPLTLIAGPCQLESRDHALHVAETLKTICARAGVQLIYKTSFDKANRTSVKGARGVGIEASLPVFKEIRDRLGIPVLTDVHLPEQCAVVAEAADVLQIPAFLCRQTDLLLAAGKTGNAVNVKKGQFLAPWEMPNVVAKIESTGNQRIS